MAAVFETEKFFEEHVKEVSVSEYFRKNLHMLGYGGAIKSMTTAVHELVSNALDACEEGKLLPEIKVSINQLGKRHYLLTVEDNGIGIPKKFIPKILGSMLSGTKFHRMAQNRGQQGIGAAGAFMFAQMTSGKPITITSSTKNVAATVVMEIDIKNNRPRILDERDEPASWRGTKVSAEYKEVKFTGGELGPFEYMKRTAVVNPHSKIVFVDPEGTRVVFDRTSSKIPPRPKSMLPHPLGVTADDIKVIAYRSKARRLGSFLQSEFCRVSAKKAKEVEEISGVDMNINPRMITHADAEKLVKTFKKVKLIAPPTDGLVPIGKRQLEISMKQMFKPDFVTVVSRSPSVYRGGIPFQIEAGISFGGESGKKTDSGSRGEIIRFANRAPLLFDAGACSITKSVQDIDWKRYEMQDFKNSPVTVVVSLVSPWVPYTSAGKQSITDDEDIVKEIKLAVMECSRKLQLHLGAIRRATLAKKRESIFLRYVPEVADALSKLTSISKNTIEDKFGTLVKSRIRGSGVIEEEVEEEKKSLRDEK
jgi:DNA topoisomerase-6 subunit B